MIGVIGGSGVYQIDGLEGASWVKVKTPWGKPSDQILVGRLGGLPMAFLPRHGRGHVETPSSLNYRANIDALKRLGCTDIVAISAVGSLREDFAPGDFVLVDQYIDRTFAREKSFFGPGCVAHVSLAHPTCTRLSAICAEAARSAGAKVHDGATYLAMEGPQFSTRAESRMYRQWGADVIGMTAMPEARLAREAELPYALIGMVTDYDAWRDHEEGVGVTEVLAVMKSNVEMVREAVRRLAESLPPTRPANPIDRVLDHAFVTAPAQRDPALVARLDAVAGRVFRA